jgi:SAM-dependent methyltransferase
MNDLETTFFQAFAGMSRMAPGSETSTRKAADLLNRQNEPLKILDIGCGNGVHSLLLARLFPHAAITAIDNHGPFIHTLNQSTSAQGLSHRVQGQVADMFQMPFSPESFDLIWSEGAIYIIGFQRGLQEWKGLLKPGGVLICSEAVWLSETPSPEIFDFWHAEYPEIDTVAAKLQQINDAGYTALGHFIMPPSDWESYYELLQQNLNHMLEKEGHSPIVQEVTQTLQREIDLYYQYGHEYSYAFFVMKKE